MQWFDHNTIPKLFHSQSRWTVWRAPHNYFIPPWEGITESDQETSLPGAEQRL